MAIKFENLKTLSAKRKRIVEDAINQIRMGVVVPTEGDYMIVDVDSEEGDFQDLLKEGRKGTCECCAKGALFVACVLNTNKVSVKGAIYSTESSQKNKLKEYFPPGELDTIEAAFEGIVIKDSTCILQNYYKDYTSLSFEAMTFGRKYSSEKARLLAILRNILKNGYFSPGKYRMTYELYTDREYLNQIYGEE